GFDRRSARSDRSAALSRCALRTGDAWPAAALAAHLEAAFSRPGLHRPGPRPTTATHAGRTEPLDKRALARAEARSVHGAERCRGDRCDAAAYPWRSGDPLHAGDQYRHWSALFPAWRAAVAAGHPGRAGALAFPRQRTGADLRAVSADGRGGASHRRRRAF